MFLPIQESHDEQNLFFPLITQSHRLLVAISRMTLGKSTENFINTNTSIRFIKGIDQVEHSCLITRKKRLRMFRQPKVEFTFTLVIHKKNNNRLWYLQASTINTLYFVTKLGQKTFIVLKII